MSRRIALTRSTLPWIVGALGLMLWALPDVVVLVGFSVLLAYALLPAVALLERVRLGRGRNLSRGVAAAIVMLALVGVVGWLLALAVPRLGAEAAQFASVAPATLRRLLDAIDGWAAAHGYGTVVGPALAQARADLPSLVPQLGGTLAAWTGRVVGGVGSLLGYALVPLLAFYLLADSAAVQSSALRFVPGELRPELQRIGQSVNRALLSYVRGQAVVCLVTGAAAALLLALLQFPAALLLGVLAGLAQLIPYIGFTVTIVTITLVGLSVDPLHAAIGAAVYFAVDWVTGTFITPRVMERYLKMHPFVVTVSVIVGARLLGPAGALLALPGAAILQAVIASLASEPKGSDAAAE
ncbi:MAG: AI-2E family transporter [Candidatus Eisenbacteria bacterium]|uniref:AI-2E family transporter n=1 Tax=Eiseniibacteriota bacterium TaxID=2212470 RepID=A0A933SCE5_UNCEI|nr:AI-2E family transporter [Candidatus Eisenbacteria bacterium]